MKSQKHNPGRLATYLTAGIGAGCLAGQADAAITVTFYGPGAQSPSTTPATPAGFQIGYGFVANERVIVNNNSVAIVGYGSNSYFTNGTDHAEFTSFGFGQYVFSNTVSSGVTVNSNQNYANITFNGTNGVYEAVGQFYLDANGGGYLVALAKNDDNSPLSISDGKAAIDAIPEPSGLALLALGAGGLLARRRRQVA